MVELGSANGDVDTNVLSRPAHQLQQELPPEMMEAVQNPQITELILNEPWLTSDISNLDLSCVKFSSECMPNYPINPSNNFLNVLGVSEGCSSFPKLIKAEQSETEYPRVSQAAGVTAWGQDLESQDPFSVAATMDANQVDSFLETQNSLSLWPSGVEETGALESVFQVDKNDLIQNPTLAELNANGDPLLELLDYDALFPLSDKSFFPQQETKYSSSTNQTAPTLNVPTTGAQYNNGKTELKVMCLPANVTAVENQSKGSVYFSSPLPSTEVKSSSVTEMQSNPSEPTPNFKSENMSGLMPKVKVEDSALLSHLLCKSSEMAPASSFPFGGALQPTLVAAEQARNYSSSPMPQEFQSLSSHESKNNCEGTPTSGKQIDLNFEEADSHLDNSDDGSSDDDSPNSDTDEDNDSSSKWTLQTGTQRNEKRKRYFWQYNLQAKGPKGPRIVLTTEPTDPHVLSSATDPVFSPSCQLEGVKHAGKARRGDGNDLTPNPRKLYLIGLELKKLNRHICDLKPVSELPSNARTRSRKEKNKLASRACRLKKKAQHEANKLKLFGLQQEHKHLLDLLDNAKGMIRHRVEHKDESLEGSCSQVLDRMMKLSREYTNAGLPKVAGRTTEFVNTILDQVTAGNSSGGLEEL